MKNVTLELDVRAVIAMVEGLDIAWENVTEDTDIPALRRAMTAARDGLVDAGNDYPEGYTHD